MLSNAQIPPILERYPDYSSNCRPVAIPECLYESLSTKKAQVKSIRQRGADGIEEGDYATWACSVAQKCDEKWKGEVQKREERDISSWGFIAL